MEEVHGEIAKITDNERRLLMRIVKAVALSCYNTYLHTHTHSRMCSLLTSEFMGEGIPLIGSRMSIAC